MGISQEEQEKYFDQEYEAFMSIPDEETLVLTIPPEEAVVEVTRMGSVIEHDKQALLDADVEQELIDSYPARAGAFIWSIVRVETFTSDQLSSDQNWATLKKEAVELRKELGRHFRRAFRKDPKLLETVDRIMTGKGDRDLALDMLTLSKLGKENSDSLGKIKQFNFELLDQAAELYVTLSDLLARIEIEPTSEEDVSIVCNKAWTYLKRALDEVYDGGKYAFPDGNERHGLYYIDYYKRLGELSAKQRAASKIDTSSPKIENATFTVLDEAQEKQSVSA